MRIFFFSLIVLCGSAFGQSSLQTGSFQTKATSAQKQSLRGSVVQAVDGGLLIYASKRARVSGYKAVEGYCVVRGVTGANGNSVHVQVVPDGTHGGYPAYKLAGDTAIIANPSLAKLPERKPSETGEAKADAAGTPAPATSEATTASDVASPGTSSILAAPPAPVKGPAGRAPGYVNPLEKGGHNQRAGGGSRSLKSEPK